ncbi:Glycosyltransferase involved in cell wall bisynthesis [Cruoricaptor ignavus]|uniref:Glycosyltransferase involved in cell wall bisynthesis n=1 Tax=Cruoricaptor ignavus TaxID=1118202 RepID=A0A1M6GVN5_9FLAO|nr:glycosyltransferase family 2 protein [Cruoricaptor ignavus]SHJ14008.1 Glycosyltransferase involved in cell wall bisynthesis [Cruoricaptor ignavus]
MKNPTLSVIVPLLNEQDSLEELFTRVDKVCRANQIPYDIWFVDDGSTDLSWAIIENLKVQNPQVRGIKFSRNYGKSQALHAAFEKVQGDVVITMDADLQDFPEEIPELYQMIAVEDFDLVSGWKKKRYDNALTKNLPSKLFNASARRLSGVKLHDFNCGLKAYKNQVVKSVDVYGDLHRWIPVLASNAGYKKITEKPVQHQARPYGVSKFGADRFVRGYLDLITLWFVSKFGGRPMHFFGAVGTLMFIIGFLAAFWLGISKLYEVYAKNIYGNLIAENPWFYISLTMMILGTLLFIAGFLGELIIRTSRGQKHYQVEEIL